MEEKIRSFFEEAGKQALEHLDSKASILMAIGGTSYALKFTEERELEIEKGGKESSDIEISGEEEIMNDLFSSSTWNEFNGKMNRYIVDEKAPRVKILMEREKENLGKFLHGYYYFLRKMRLLS